MLIYKMCKQCQKNPVYEFTNKKKLCKGCFIKYFQKKFFYIIRKFKMIKKDDVVGYRPEKDSCGVVLEKLLNIFKDKGIIELVKLPNKKKFDKIAVTSTLDSEADRIVHTLIQGKTNELKQLSPMNGKTIKPLYLFLNEEILLYAKLKKLTFKEKKIKKDKITKFIDELEDKHPEIKRAIINSYLELYG